MEAYHMHQLLISVFVKPESHFLLKRALFAWGKFNVYFMEEKAF